MILLLWSANLLVLAALLMLEGALGRPISPSWSAKEQQDELESVNHLSWAFNQLRPELSGQVASLRDERKVDKVGKMAPKTVSDAKTSGQLLVERRLQQLEQQLVQQAIGQRVSEKDHLLMESWLVDNIKDLHRELKQTETDFEHYVQVTKNILLRNENQLKRQLAQATSLPLSLQLQVAQWQASPPEQSHRRSLAAGGRPG